MFQEIGLQPTKAGSTAPGSVPRAQTCKSAGPLASGEQSMLPDLGTADTGGQVLLLGMLSCAK